MAGRELFVWYRVRRGRVDEALVQVVAMQQSLTARFTRLRARLLVRSETSTWMETYATDDAGGIDPRIEAAIAEAAGALAALLDGSRHVEAFTEAT